MKEQTAEMAKPRTRFGVWVQGRCPACNVASLFVGSGGYLTCGNISCPNPVSPSEALGIVFHKDPSPAQDAATSEPPDRPESQPTAAVEASAGEGLRTLVSDWQANGNSRPLSDPTAATWQECAIQLLRVIDGQG